MENALRPRLCFLTKGATGYGFHLHGERNKGGQFIRKVELGSSADMAGLRPGDRVVEVNGENVENESHQQVVSLICEVPYRTRLLVVDRETDEYLHSCGLPCTEDLAVEMGTLSPRPSPAHTPSASPLPRGSSPLTPKPSHFFTAVDVRRSTQVRSKRSSLTSSTATDPELQVEPSPEPSEEPLPRLCHLVKGENGYGFNLHNNKSRGGQFVRSVDPGSPAELSDLRLGDRLVEVNGVNIEGLRHSEVVALIRAELDGVRLLVVDRETDELFLRLGITPTSSHVKEAYVEESAQEEAYPTPSPTTSLPTTHTPIIHVTLTDTQSNTSPKSRTNGSSASQSSRSSTTHSEVSSSDMSIQVLDEDDRRVSDPFMESGLRLSPTAAEAKQKVLANRNKKRAPPMDWSQKYKIFSNF
ncbi:Na(+)/H(+) exchange regulatory cofactor NHE-RF2 isoform 1-T1 [Synchiropus picturatus]